MSGINNNQYDLYLNNQYSASSSGNNNKKQLIEEFLKNQLQNKTFNSLEELEAFCGEFYDDLNIQQVYGNSTWNYYTANSKLGEGAYATIMIAKNTESPKTTEPEEETEPANENSETDNTTNINEAQDTTPSEDVDNSCDDKNRAKLIQDFLNNQLQNKTFNSLNEFKQFCSEYLDDLVTKLRYEDNNNYYYEISSNYAIGSSVSVAIAKNITAQTEPDNKNEETSSAENVDNTTKSDNTTAADNTTTAKKQEESIRDFLKNELKGKKFASLNEFKQFCSEYLDNLEIKQAYEDSNTNYLSVGSTLCPGIYVNVTIAKNIDNTKTNEIANCNTNSEKTEEPKSNDDVKTVNSETETETNKKKSAGSANNADNTNEKTDKQKDITDKLYNLMYEIDTNREKYTSESDFDSMWKLIDEIYNNPDKYPNLSIIVSEKEDKLCDIELRRDDKYYYNVDDIPSREANKAEETTVNETSETDNVDNAEEKENAEFNSAQQTKKYNTEVYSDEIITNITEMLQEKVTTDINYEMVETMIADLTKMAESKGVDPTEYVNSRLVDFVTMREAYPDMSLDEMNEQMALGKVSNVLFENAASIYSDIYGEDIESINDLLKLQESTFFIADYEPELKNAYINTRELMYIQTAQDGKFTKEDYYNCLKNDLANIFPLLSDMSEDEINELLTKIDKLDLDQVKRFINQCITLPSADDENYLTQYSAFISDFNNTVNNSKFMGIENPDELMNINSVYKEITGAEFDADGIIDSFDKLEEAKILMNATNVQRTIENIQSKVENGELSIGDALWQMAYLSTGSTEDEDILEFVKTVTGIDNARIEDASVIIENSAGARGTNGRRSAAVPQDEEAYNNTIKYYNETYQASTGCTNTAEADSKIAATLSDPNFYRTIGDWANGAAGVVFAGGTLLAGGQLATGAGAPTAAATFTFSCEASTVLAQGAVVAHSIGDTLEFYQTAKREGFTEENVKDYAWEMAKNGAELALTTQKVNKMIHDTVWKGLKWAGNAIKDALSSSNTTYSSIAQLEAACISGGGSNSSGIFGSIKKLFGGGSKSSASQLEGYKVNKVLQKIEDGKYANSGYGAEIIIDTKNDKKLISKIMQLKYQTKGLSETEKAEFLYEYMLENVGLSRGAKISSINSRSFPTNNLLGDIFSNPELIEKTVCRHRAIYFQRLGKSLGLNTSRVIGDYCGTPHAWNMVEINGKKYMFDTMLGIKGIPCDDLMNLSNSAGVAKYGSVFTAALALFASTNINAQTVDNTDAELSLEELEEQIIEFTSQMDNFVAKYGEDPSSQSFIEFMDAWVNNTNNYNWDSMVTAYTSANPNKVVQMPDGTVKYQGETYGSLAIWSYMNGNKYAVKLDENGNAIFVSQGQTDEYGELIDMTKVNNIDVVGTNKSKRYTDSNGNQWKSYGDFVDARVKGYNDNKQYYNDNPEGVQSHTAVDKPIIGDGNGGYLINKDICGELADMLSTLNGFENLPELIEAVKNGIIPAELFNEMDGDLVNMFTMLANSFRTDNKSDNTHNYSKDLTGLEYLDLNPDLKDMKDLYYKLVSTGYSESQAKAIIKQYALGIESNEMDVKEAVKEIKRMAYVRETTNRAIEDIKQLWNAHGYYGEAAVILNQMNIGAYSEDNMETLLMIKNILSNPAFEIDYEHGDHYVTGGFKIKVSEDWAAQLQLDYDAQYAGNVYDEDGNLVNDNGAASLAYFDMLAQIDQAETDAAKYEKYLKQYFGQA